MQVKKIVDKILLAFIILAMSPGCKTVIEPSAGSRNIEFVSANYVRSERADVCREVGQFDVVALPNEKARHDTLSVAEVKARNEAARLRATHVLRWPTREFPCDEDGTENEESEKMCVLLPATAYVCMIGSGRT